MKFCKECGGKLTPENKNCPACGTEVPVSAPTPSTTNGKTNVNFLESLSKKHKILVLSIAAVLIVGFIGIQIGKSMFTPDRFVDNFQQALIDNDLDKLGRYIVSSDARLKVNDESIEAFLTHINNNPSFLGEITNTLNSQVALLDNKGSNRREVYSDAQANNYILTLRKQGKNLLFFDRYVVEPMAYYITLHTNYPDTKLYINDEEIDIASRWDFSREYGPFMPGVYSLRAILEGEYVNLETEYELTIFDIYNNHVDVNLQLYGSFVSTSSNYDDTELLANGVNTGLLVNDVSDFGPVPSDGSVVLQGVKEFPWGTIKSDEISLTGQSNVHLFIPSLNNDLKNDLMEAMNNYYVSYVDALMEFDASLLKNASVETIASMEEAIDNYSEYGLDYQLELTEVIYDLSSFSITQDNGTYQAYVNSRQYVNYIYGYYDPEGTEPNMNSTYHDWQHTLIYDEGTDQWLMDNSRSIYSINTYDVESFEF